MIQSEQSRKDMLIYNGAAWFYILLGWYTLQSTVSLWFERQGPNGDLRDAAPVVAWIAMGLTLVGGTGIIAGLFSRPRWHGWEWIIANFLAMVGQYIYSDLWRSSWLAGRASASDWADEFVFACWLAVGLFGTLMDTVKGPYACPTCHRHTEDK